MKTTVFVAIFLLIGITGRAQEGFKIGLQAALPYNDFNDEVAIVVGLDTGYSWALGETIDVGVTVGFIYGFHETFQSTAIPVDLPDIQFVPIGASVRIWPSNSFSFGIEGGPAFGLNDGNEGGLYYRPMLGYLFNANAEVNFSHRAIILDNRSWTTFAIGLLYTFNP